MGVFVTFGQRVGEFRRPVTVAPLVDTDELAFLQVALNAVLRDPAANLLLCRFREIPQHARTLQAVQVFHFEHVLALAAADQSSAASRSAEAHALGLE